MQNSKNPIASWNLILDFEIDEIVNAFWICFLCSLLFELNAVTKYSLFAFIFFLMVAMTGVLVTLQVQLVEYLWATLLEYISLTRGFVWNSLKNENAELMDMSVFMMLAFWIFGVLFLMCELGERVTNQFIMFGEENQQSDWHMLPIKMQRMYLVFLLDTQQPKNTCCYGRISCTRDTFKQVFSWTWSKNAAKSRDSLNSNL